MNYSLITEKEYFEKYFRNALLANPLSTRGKISLAIMNEDEVFSVDAPEKHDSFMTEDDFFKNCYVDLLNRNTSKKHLDELSESSSPLFENEREPFDAFNLEKILTCMVVLTLI